MDSLKHKQVGNLRDRHPHQKIVYCSGSFDLLHAGHVLFLEDCKRMGEILVVEVGSDKMVRELDKGAGRPIYNEHIRLKLIGSLKTVDYCFIGEHENPNQKFSSIERTFKLLKPNVYVVNQDAYDIPYRQQLAERYGVKMIILERICPPEYEIISTSRIINKIRGLE